MLGKELRSSANGTWLNYALPVAAFAPTVDDIIAGRFTPARRPTPIVPQIPSRSHRSESSSCRTSSPARHPTSIACFPIRRPQRAGIRPDDLFVTIDSQVASSCTEANHLTERLERDATVRLAVLRNEQFLEFTLSTKPAEPTKDNPKDTTAPEKKQADDATQQPD